MTETNHHEVDRWRDEYNDGFKQTKVELACGHVYTMGVSHDCNCPGCPAGALP